MSIPTSIELWAASKIVGRECARVNKDFYVCKKNNGPEPQRCEAQGNSVTNCATKMWVPLLSFLSIISLHTTHYSFIYHTFDWIFMLMWWSSVFRSAIIFNLFWLFVVGVFPSWLPSVNTLNTEYPVEFTAFQKCLDYNDYRFADCRKTERSLLDCWNQKMGYLTNA